MSDWNFRTQPGDGKIKKIIIENILESAPIGLLVINSEGEIIKVNQNASRILGYPVTTLEGKGWGELFFEDQINDEFNQVIVDVVLKKEINLRRTVVYHSPEGAMTHLNITSSFLDEKGDLAGIVVLLDDVTDVVQGQLREKAILEEKNRIEKERAVALRNLALGVAHEVRNPMVIIGGFAHRLRRNAQPGSPEEQSLDKIINGAKRLEDIVRSVKDYASIPGLTMKEVSLKEILEAAVVRSREQARTWCKKVDFDVKADSIDIKADPALLVSALFEIMENSIIFLEPKGGVITVRADISATGTVITISDNGPGIKEKDLPFIFDPFFSTRADGIGMGLCKAQHIAAEHGGNISVESKKGAGTVFSLFFPHKREKSLQP